MSKTRRLLFWTLVIAASLAAQWDLGTGAHRFTANEISIDLYEEDNPENVWQNAYFTTNLITLTGSGTLTIVDADGEQLALTLRNGSFVH